jgi:murein DD-endopeptidase MepM/ murein hydrolase activator NlpD
VKARHRLRTGIAMIVVTVCLAFTGRDMVGVSAGPSDISDGAVHAPRTARTSGHDALAALRQELPVRGPINSGFGTRHSAWWTGRVHRGIDIGARRGTPVRIPAAGVVVFVGWRHGYGRTIIVDHGQGVQSLYGHLSKIDVTRGQRLQPRATIGLTGLSGNASGSHLHYEIHVKGRPVNPLGAPSATAFSRHPRARSGQFAG